MQDRYAGDVGDVGKFALLRALSPGRKLGVCWYRCTGEGESNNDGKHVGYLDKPRRFRHLDPEVFDALRELVRRERSVAALQRTDLLPGARWHGELVPGPSTRREAWFRQAMRAVGGCDLLFADPDNGISVDPTPKHITVAEIHAMRRPGRALLVYKHQGRTKGGAQADARETARRVGIDSVDVIRLRPGTSRFYFLFDGDDTLRTRLAEFAARWTTKRAELIDVRG
jgi:hypothetical protein